MNYESIHKIPGFRIGHTEDTAALTGCTVILCDEKTCGGVDQRMATGLFLLYSALNGATLSSVLLVYTTATTDRKSVV